MRKKSKSRGREGSKAGRTEAAIRVESVIV